MAERQLSTLQQLDSGAHSADTYLGGFIAAMRGFYLPARGAGGSDHATQAVDMLWSIAQRLYAAADVRVYSDTSDSDTQFSVSSFTLSMLGKIYAYAGAVNLGPLTAGQVNYISLDCRTPATPAIVISTSGWPSYPHLRIATIAQPGANAWRAENLTQYAGVHDMDVHVGRMCVTPETAIAYNSSSPVSCGWVPAGARVYDCLVGVTTTFNGTSPTISVGDAGSAARHMGTGDNTPGSIGVYSRRNYHLYASATEVTCTITVSGASQGAGWVRLAYLIGD